ncbi:MAG: RNA polymerase sigma factor [Planctomycetes bacterium]|nr:RNA polymerase sigma factor [Planctomycetota bacterium]
MLRSAEHMDWIRRLAGRLVRDADMRDDLVQESLLASWIRRASLRFPRAFGASYLRRGEVRAARGNDRRSRRELAGGPRAIGSHDVDPADAAERAELCSRVLAALAALDEPHRSTLALRFIDGLEPAAIAARTGVPAATVRSRIGRGLDRMREALDSAYHGERRTWVRGLVALSTSRWPWAAWMAAAGLIVVCTVTMWPTSSHEVVTSHASAREVVASREDEATTEVDVATPTANRNEVTVAVVADAVTHAREHRVLVTTEGGTVLPGATVALCAANGALDERHLGDRTLTSAISGPDGRAVLQLDGFSDDEADREVIVTCAGRGRVRAALAIDQYEQRVVFPDTAATFGPLRVLAVDDSGNALAGATLVGVDDFGARDVVTDAYGRAQLTHGNVHATRCTLVAHDGIPETVTIEADRFDAGARVIRASARIAIAFRVIDAVSRRPIAGAVWREAGRIAFRDVPYRTFARSDAFGHIAVKLPAARVRGNVPCLVVIDAPGFASTEVLVTDVAGAEREVSLEPERVIRGRVVDGSGEPQRDVDVLVNLNPVGIFPVADPARPESAAQQWNWIGNRGALLRTDARGVFELRGAPAAVRGRVGIRDVDEWTAEPVSIEPTPGSSLLELPDLVRAPRAEAEFAEIRGVVRFNGKAGPIPWVCVGGGVMRRGHADVDGTFRIPRVAPGKAVVRFLIPGLQIDERVVDAQAGETIECSVNMECPVTAIRGTVVDDAGRPQAGILLTIRAEGRTLAAYGTAQAWTRTDGSFETLAAIEAGAPLRAVVLRPGKRDVTIEGTAGVDLRITLPPDSAD